MSTDTRWEAYINWLVMDETQRRRLNLPLNNTEYALANSMPDRTLRRWKADPVFQALLEKKQGKKAVPASVPEGDEDLEPGDEPELSQEDEYQEIKSTLVKGAKTGDPKYLDLYFKTYGKDFVAEEAAARTSDLAGLDLDSLILTALDSLAPEGIADYLRSKGYTITEGEAYDG